MAKGKSSDLLTSVAAFIVDKRTLFFLLYLFAAIFSVFSKIGRASCRERV